MINTSLNSSKPKIQKLLATTSHSKEKLPSKQMILNNSTITQTSRNPKAAPNS